MRLQGPLLWRDMLSSDPWYAAQAKRDEELSGDPMSLWKTLFASRPFMLMPPKGPSTPEQTMPTR